MFSEPEPERLRDESSSSSGGISSSAVAEPPPVGEDWSGFLMRERYAKLRDIALSISVRRTIDEAELALQLADDFGADPSILQDIDFVSLMRRVDRDLRENVDELSRSDLVSKAELETLRQRQRAAIDSLQELQPEALATASGAVAEAVPKIRRVISKARELPLAIELPSSLSEADGLDLQLVFNESKNVAVAVQDIWERLTGADASRDLELVSLQRESRALLALVGSSTS